MAGSTAIQRCSARPTTRPSGSSSAAEVCVLRPSVPRPRPRTTCSAPVSREYVDPRGHPGEHHHPFLESAGPAADAVEGRPGGGDQVVGDGLVGRPGAGDPGQAVLLGDRSGEDPQPVGAVGAAHEAGRERVRAEAGVRRLRGPGLGDRDRLDRQLRRRRQRPSRGPPVRRRAPATVDPVDGLDAHRGVQRRRREQRDGDPGGGVQLGQRGERAGGPAAVAGAGRAAEASGHESGSARPDVGTRSRVRSSL